MDFWSPLAEQLWASRTPFVVALYILTRALVRISARSGVAARPGSRSIERYHLRVAGTMLVLHLGTLAICVGQRSYGYDGVVLEIASYAFEAFAALSLATTALFRALLPRIGFVLPRIMIDLITAVGVAVVFIAVGRRAGFSVAGLITTSAVLTAVIGFSLQDTLGNVMGGLTVQLDKSIAVGDWVTVNNVSGRVSEIRWRYTAIETRSWNTVIVPNGVLVKSQVMIWGKYQGMAPPRQRRDLDFFVDFRTPPTQVAAAVETALRGDPVRGMATEPRPVVLFMNVRESEAHYQARYWLEDLGPDETTDSAVRTRVWYALRRAGIPMAIPASAVFLTQENAERDVRKADRERDQRLRAIGKVDLFDGLTDAARQALAGHLEFMPYAAGEAITREGERDDGLFIIVEGEASVRIGKGHTHREVARLAPGQFFGEMSLMTGEVRTATVIAGTDIVCYRVSKSAFQEVLEQTPAIAEQVAEVLTTRKTELSAARDEHEGDRKKRMETAKRDLTSRIRDFFGLDAVR